MAEDTEGLRFEVDDTVRFSSECLIVRNVFLNWSARNPEVQFCSPICSKPLKTLLEKEPVTFDDTPLPMFPSLPRFPSQVPIDSRAM